jgi:hypothetical protein
LLNIYSEGDKTMVRITMKNADAESASTESTPVSDAEMADVLANSSWAKMERDAKRFAANSTQESWKENCRQDRCA